MVTSRVSVSEVINLANGKRITVTGFLSYAGVTAIEVSSQFFVTGRYDDVETNFRRKTIEKTITVNDIKTKSILESKSWIQLE